MHRAHMETVGTVRGKFIELDDPVPAFEGQRVRLVVEEASDKEMALSSEEQALLWQQWVESGPQGPIDEEDNIP